MTSICIDGFNLTIPKGSGIATYGRNLLDAAHALGFGTQVLYGPTAAWKPHNALNEALLAEGAPAVLQDNRRLRIKRFRDTFLSQFGRSAYPVQPSGQVIWPSDDPPLAQTYWTAQDLFARAGRSFHRYGKLTPTSFKDGETAAPSLMHWTAPLPLYSTRTPNIYTFHDLIPLRLPHTVGGDKARFLDMGLKIAARADHIVVVSEATRQDVVRLLGVDERRITNTYQAVHIPEAVMRLAQEDVALELEGIFQLGWKDYFLHFGAVEPKKNLGRIVEAYLASGVKRPLVLIGGRAWLDEGEVALLNQIKRDGGGNADRIRQYDYLSSSTLLSLIRGARGVLFPSLYEGFGLPVLEAMALSTAVLTSTGGALPEVAGDAALLVDPHDVQAIKMGIRALDLDDDLRGELERRGPFQAAKFSPASYRAKLLHAYSAVGVAP